MTPAQGLRSRLSKLDTLHLGVFTGNAGQVRQRTELTDTQRAILTKLEIDEPPRFLRIDTAD